MPTISEGLLRDLRRLAVVSVDDRAQRLERARDLWPQALWWDEAELGARAPSVVMRPGTEEEAAAILRWASAQGVPVVPRGNGSGVCGAAVPDAPDAVILETLGLDDVSVDAARLTVRAGSGVLGGELERRLNAEGLSLRHFPASLEISTVGGWLAAGSYGQMSTLYGGADRQTLAVRTALADGTLLDEDAGPLWLSEGALGVAVRADLSIRTLPKRQDFLAARFEELGPALACSRELMTQGTPPAVIRLYDALDAGATGVSGGGGSGGGFLPESWVLSAHARALGYPGLVSKVMGGSHWLLVVVVEDSPEEAARAESALSKHGGRLDAAPARRWWKRRYHWDHRKLTGLMARGCFVDTLDVEASWEKLPAVYQAMSAARPEGVLGMGHFAHFEKDSACLYMSVAGRFGARAATRAAHAETWRRLIDAAVSAGARPTHHHGVGLAKRPWRDRCLGPLAAEQKRLKAARDPRGILMPGRV